MIIGGSAVVMNGPGSELGAVGYPRDFRDQSRLQVEFLVTYSKSPDTFLYPRLRGNISGPVQYKGALPDIFRMVRQGLWVIMDNGGASGDISDPVIRSGNQYLIRVKLNVSGEKIAKQAAESWQYVEDGVCCLSHRFESSGRTTYLYWSLDNWMRSYKVAERSVDRMICAMTTYESGNFRKSDFVTVKRSVLADVYVTVFQQRKLKFTDEECEGLIREVMGPRAGLFKLESSVQLIPAEALDKHCARATVEHLIHSLKRVTGIKPLKVWN